jgi:hypothetical protein
MRIGRSVMFILRSTRKKRRTFMLRVVNIVVPTYPEGLISPQGDIVSSFWNVIFGRVSNVTKNNCYSYPSVHPQGQFRLRLDRFA